MPPHDIMAEKSVLGAMLLSSMAVAKATEILKADDFYMQAHKKIFESMVSLSIAAKNVDMVTVSDSLDKLGLLEEVAGGYSYLAELSGFVPVIANVEQYANIVRNHSLLRQLIDIAGVVTTDCYDDTKDTFEIIAGAEKLIFGLSQSNDRKRFVHIKDAANVVMDNVEERFGNPGAITGLRTGFAALDKLMSGMNKGELILVAARPGMGKSALALNIAQQAAYLDSAKVGVFTLEMPYDQLAERLMSSIGNLPLSTIKSGLLSDSDWKDLDSAGEKLGKCDILIDDSSGITLPEMLSKCRRLKAEVGLDLVVVDYLQLISSYGRRDNRQQEVSEMTRMLKVMSMDLNIPIIVLSQLSRAPEQRQNHRPILSDLRESGSIEQDADVVMFIYREGYYRDRENGEDIDLDKITNEAEIIVAKHRSGPTGTVKLTWLGEIVRFVDMDSEHLK